MTAKGPLSYSDFPWPDDNEEIHLIEGTALGPGTTLEWPSAVSLCDAPLLEDISCGAESPWHSIAADMAHIEAAPALQVIPIERFNVEAISAELDGNLSYAVEEIKSAPRTMLSELRTPWCHVSLYKDDMPRVMQGQFCCVLEDYYP